MQSKVHALSGTFVMAGLLLLALLCGATGCDVARQMPTSAPEPTLTPVLAPTVTPVTEIPLEILSARNALLAFFRTEYPHKAPPDGVVWIGRETTPSGVTGISTYEFTGDDWLITVAALATSPADLLYELGLSYTPKGLRWTGRLDATYQLLESNLNVAAEVLVVREIVLGYVREHYAGPALNLVWVGERTTPSGLVGHETCQFTSTAVLGSPDAGHQGETASAEVDPWTMSVEYDVVNPALVIYEVELRQASSEFLWRGQVDAEGTILEHH